MELNYFDNGIWKSKLIESEITLLELFQELSKIKSKNFRIYNKIVDEKKYIIFK